MSRVLFFYFLLFTFRTGGKQATLFFKSEMLKVYPVAKLAVRSLSKASKLSGDEMFTMRYIVINI